MAEPSKKTLYMREYRAKNKVGRIEERAGTRAHSRALTRLSHMHPDEYESLLNEERWVEGLPPVGATSVGRPPLNGKRVQS